MSDVVIASNITTKIKRVEDTQTLAYSPNAVDPIYSTTANEYMQIDYFSTSAANSSIEIRSGSLVLFSGVGPYLFNRLAEDIIPSGKKIIVPPMCDLVVVNGGSAQNITSKLLGTSTINSP